MTEPNQRSAELTKERDALLEGLRAFVAADTNIEASLQYMRLERLVQTMKDVAVGTVNTKGD